MRISVKKVGQGLYPTRVPDTRFFTGPLVRAKSQNPEVYLEDLCFDAQQAAEKAIKAIFVCRAEPFPYIHDLEKLLTILAANGVKIPKYVREAQRLSPFAAVARYPDKVALVSPSQYRRAVRIAAAVLAWAERKIAAASR